MAEITKAKLRAALQQDGLPDYALLACRAARPLYPELLAELLTEAEAAFAEILQTPAARCNFANIVDRFLTMDEDLNHLFSFLNNLNHTDAHPALRRLIEDFQPQIIAYHNLISTHPRLFALLKEVMQTIGDQPQQKRATALLIRDMEFAGVGLKGKKKERLNELNIELARLSEQFQNNVLDDRKRFFHHFADAGALADMPPESLAAAADEAKRRRRKGYVFTLSPPSYQAVMKFCSDREIRKRFWQKSSQVASTGKFDNRETILSILQLRHEKAQLLGHPSYAHYVLTTRMAKDPAEAFDMMQEMAQKSRHHAESELDHLRRFARLDDFNHWDMAYYSEKLLKKTLGVDDKALKPYFPLEEALGGAFTIAGRLFDIRLVPLKAPLYNPSVTAYEVYAGSEPVAYFLFDPYARPQKQGGAWCNEFRGRKLLPEGAARLPVIINVANFAKGSKTDPTLLTHDNVQVIFHEFGHALHLILGKSDYANLSGFNTEWDFVELPSQLLENWTWEKDSLSLFARHWQTGKVMPKKLTDALHQSRVFLKGLFLLRQTEFGLLDFTLHTEAPPQTIAELDRRCHEIAQANTVIPKPRDYRMYASFSHIFAGGYAAGYYSYLWAEILEADVFEVFQKHGILDAATGKRFRDRVLAPGAAKDGYELFTDFVGRKPNPKALLKKLGIGG